MTASVEVRRAAQRFVTRTDGLDARHCFSFGSHYDPGNVGHGSLLASNDERVSVGAGYDDHPHRDIEVVTWVLSGSLLHQDSSGHRGVVTRGLAQRMSAGQGIVHAERNDAYQIEPDRTPEPVRFVQMWLRPDEPGRPPSYEQRALDPSDLHRAWVPVAAGSHPDACVTVGARNAAFWVTVLAPGVSRLLPEAAYVHAYVARGRVELETAGILAEGDSVRITGRAALRVTGHEQPGELLVWAMGEPPGV